jgi:hypothetical protein
MQGLGAFRVLSRLGCVSLALVDRREVDEDVL